tara:strand:+ start:163 stop:594 length:432 start_codon:yes stop_codon:yes gene_type:complete
VKVIPQLLVHSAVVPDSHKPRDGAEVASNQAVIGDGARRVVRGLVDGVVSPLFEPLTIDQHPYISWSYSDRVHTGYIVSLFPLVSLQILWPDRWLPGLKSCNHIAQMKELVQVLLHLLALLFDTLLLLADLLFKWCHHALADR